MEPASVACSQLTYTKISPPLRHGGHSTCPSTVSWVVAYLTGPGQESLELHPVPRMSHHVRQGRWAILATCTSPKWQRHLKSNAWRLPTGVSTRTAQCLTMKTRISSTKLSTFTSKPSDWALQKHG